MLDGRRIRLLLAVQSMHLPVGQMPAGSAQASNTVCAASIGIRMPVGPELLRSHSGMSASVPDLSHTRAEWKLAPGLPGRADVVSDMGPVSGQR